MAATPYPLSASTRQTAALLGDGNSVYGPFGTGWGIFDEADVRVETRAASPGTDPWLEQAVTITKTVPTDVYSPFTVTFSAPLTSATQFRVSGLREPRRELAIARGTALDTDQLEAELSAINVSLQEQRRDIDAIPAIVAGDAASQAAASAASAAAALATIQGLGVDPTGYLSKSGNLSGLASSGTARINLGLGSAATQPSTAFATALHTHTPDGVWAGVRRTTNLKIANDAVSPNSKMVITADEAILKSAAGVAVLHTGVSVTVDITLGVAVNGLDAGAEAANTWYHLWLVSNGTTIAGLISTSSSAPTLPGAYVYYAYAGCVRNDGSSNFRKTWAFGNIVWQAPVDVLNGNGVTSATLLDLSAAVPTNAVAVEGRSYTNANINANLHLASDNFAGGPMVNLAGDLSGSWPIDGLYPGQSYRLPLLVPQTLWRKHLNALAGYVINVFGFTLPQGN